MSYPWLRELWQKWLADKQANHFAHAHAIPWNPDAASDTLIRTLATWLLCLQATTKPCGQCKSCKLMQANSHPDFHLIQPNQELKSPTIGVDTIRALTNSLQETANQGQNKVAVIEQADKMTVAASNALLKTLEEPQANTYIILAPERMQHLLPTLRSRMQVHRLPSLETLELAQWLTQQTGDVIASSETWLQGYRTKPLKALARVKQAPTSQTSEVELLSRALIDGEPWPELTGTSDSNDWLVASETLVHDLIRLKQRLSPWEIERHETVKGWLERHAVSVHMLSTWLHEIIELKAQQRQSGLNLNLLISSTWTQWHQQVYSSNSVA